MNIQKILFPTDFSKYNEAALKYATRLAVDSGATLHLVHVQDVRDLSAASGEASYLYSTQWEEERHRTERLLHRTVPPDTAVRYEHHQLTGIPESEIVAFAKENQVDLIVMASHGRTGISRLVMGSVAESVMRKATCPVLVVKEPQPQEQSSEEQSATGALA